MSVGRVKGVACRAAALWWAGLVLWPLLSMALSPIPLPESSASPKWDGPQFFVADKAGRVSLLRGRTLQVFPVRKTGNLGEPARLKATMAWEDDLSNAALDGSGSQWLLQSFKATRWFVDGQEKSLPPLDWLPGAVGFRRDEPIVAAIPFHIGATKIDPGVTPPWLMARSGESWQALVEAEGLTAGEALAGLKVGKLNDYQAEWTACLLSDAAGKLWVARVYAYRLQRFSPGGRLLGEWRVGEGKVQSRAEADKGPVEIRVHGTGRDAVAAPGREPEKKPYFGFTAEAAILAATMGPGGTIYLLTRAPEGVASLDRFDPGTGRLERSPLSIKIPGRATLAAGKDALYLADYNGRGGRWRIPWPAVEQARWKKVRVEGNQVSEE